MSLLISEAYSSLIESHIPFANDKKAKKLRKAAQNTDEIMSCNINNYTTFINDGKKTNKLIRLTGAGCQLRNADLSNKNFSKKTFKGADLRGVNFTNSRFYETDFRFAQFDSQTNFSNTYVFNIKYSNNFPWSQFAAEDKLTAKESEQARTTRLIRTEKEYLKDIKNKIPEARSKIEKLTNTEKKIFYSLIVGRVDQGTESFYQGVRNDIDALIESTKQLVTFIKATRVKLKTAELDNPGETEDNE